MSGTDKADDEEPPNIDVPRLSSGAAIKTHLTLLLGLALCGLAFWFELRRAEGGNNLSWAYVFEWPLLGIFAIYMWWKLLHPGFTIRHHRERPDVAPEYKGMLAAWQSEQRKLELTRLTDEDEASRMSNENDETS